MKEFFNSISLKTKLVVVLVALVSMSLAYKWYSPAAPPAGVVTMAPVAKVVAGVPTKTIAATKLVVYDKAEVVKKVKLPEEVAKAETKQITSVSDVAPSRAGVTVTTATDTISGETTVYQEVKKLPLLGFGGEARLGASYVALGSPAVNAHLQYDFIRIGNAYGHVRGEVEQKIFKDKPEVKGMVGIDYVW